MNNNKLLKLEIVELIKYQDNLLKLKKRRYHRYHGLVRHLLNCHYDYMRLDNPSYANFQEMAQYSGCATTDVVKAFEDYFESRIERDERLYQEALREGRVFKASKYHFEGDIDTQGIEEEDLLTA